MENVDKKPKMENENLEEIRTNLDDVSSVNELQTKSVDDNKDTKHDEINKEKISEQDVEIANETVPDDNVSEVDVELKTETELNKKEEENVVEEIAWNTLSREEILQKTEDLINTKNILAIKDHITTAKNEFYRKLKEETNNLKEEFVAENGEEKEFIAAEDKIEIEFKHYLNIYKDKKYNVLKELEKQKEENLNRKAEIIEEIKSLVNSQETFNKTFQEFKNLQTEFNALGDVPQKEYKTIWNNYHTAQEIFYDYLKINKELRDLDFKKSYNKKIELCEKAENLDKQEDIIEAHKTLQNLHDAWKKIGPVFPEKRDEIWERFSAITKLLNKKHQDFYDSLKEIKNENLILKDNICIKIEGIVEENFDSIKDWNQRAKIIEEIQAEWKAIGPTPKNTNKETYKRFRTACDTFYNKRKEFYAQIKKEQQANLQQKYELCESVEKLVDSDNWKETTNKIIRIQKDWKNIGPVPRKKSDQVWKRFRTACDNFFNNKTKHFAGQLEQEKENLILKEKLIEEIEQFKQLDDVKETISKLKEFQTAWNNIGFVPLENKKEINIKFKNILNGHYDKLNIDTKEKDLLRLKSKLEEIANHPDSIEKLKIEKDKLLKRISQFESETVLLENNIGFFSASANADNLLKDIKNKINTARENIDLLKDRLKTINQYINKATKENKA